MTKRPLEISASDNLGGQVTSGNLLPQLATSDNPTSAGANRVHVIQGTGELGRLVRDARQDRKQSQQDFADLAGVGRRFLSELENGKATLEFDKVLKVAVAAGIDLFARKRG